MGKKGIARQPTLFGEVAVVRCWGRIGTGGCSMSSTYPDAAHATEACADLERRKCRRG
ncbi:WGR domain-containing protein [uncultured Tateyamaria sp.]|uniref:WGR domain-containing protein n=1 Tax=uncultured Tateyamaria sp. TaxID=455651 RepID=UPI0026114D41|nr:WGR domain-containing protein [uncultured Tateyamaria sp.]